MRPPDELAVDREESFRVNEEVLNLEVPSIQLTCGPDVVHHQGYPRCIHSLPYGKQSVVLDCWFQSAIPSSNTGVVPLCHWCFTLLNAG